STPYRWPYDGNVSTHRCALIIIDMQTDFCGYGGYIDAQGIDISLTRAVIKPLQNVLAAARKHPDLLIIHTREGHRPELVDLPENKRWRSQRVCPGIGEPGPAGRILVKGEPGWEIIPELQPAAGEIIIDKPGKGAFYATDLEHILRTCGITHLILTGITTDVCVHTTMREANDRGFECLILKDCTAATETHHRDAIFTMTEMQGGLFGCTSSSQHLIAALDSIL
ncbi:MAG TPA: isochorismatase family cysteine hydrolase, partial [Pseudomonadales bacterium]|nr:isochorismatase family cysteine hydrolase [Pseudomonadales bacterium]